MKKSLIISTFLALVLLMPTITSAQNTLKLRVSGNSTRLLGEPQGKEVNFPGIDSMIINSGPFDDFTNKGNFGIDAELMLSLSKKMWIGLEISSSKMSGTNNNPPFYNFQYSDFNQLVATDTATGIVTTFITNLPVKYKTSLLNIIGNLRFYPSPDTRFRPFAKLHAGVSFISTELLLKDTEAWKALSTNPNHVFGPPVLYSRGTADAKDGVVPALNMGIGAGAEFQITEKIALYADYTYSMINSDILDGRPNFDYSQTTGKIAHFNTWANVGKVSLGLVYTIGENFAIFSGGRNAGKSVGKGGRVHPYLPYYEIKRN